MEQSGYRNRRDADHIYDRLYNNHYSSPSVMDHQPTEQFCAPQHGHINSDVVEITDVQGSVGFVAVGRIPKSASHNPMSYEEMQYCEEKSPAFSHPVLNENSKAKHRSKSEVRHKTPDPSSSPIRNTRSASEMQSTNRTVEEKSINGHSLLIDHASHSRHSSDPTLYSKESGRNLTRYPKTFDLTAGSDEAQIVASSDPSDKPKSRKPKSTQDNGKSSTRGTS